MHTTQGKIKKLKSQNLVKFLQMCKFLTSILLLFPSTVACCLSCDCFRSDIFISVMMSCNWGFSATDGGQLTPSTLHVSTNAVAQLLHYIKMISLVFSRVSSLYKICCQFAVSFHFAHSTINICSHLSIVRHIGSFFL